MDTTSNLAEDSSFGSMYITEGWSFQSARAKLEMFTPFFWAL